MVAKALIDGIEPISKMMNAYAVDVVKVKRAQKKHETALKKLRKISDVTELYY